MRYDALLDILYQLCTRTFFAASTSKATARHGVGRTTTTHDSQILATARTGPRAAMTLKSDSLRSTIWKSAGAPDLQWPRILCMYTLLIRDPSLPALGAVGMRPSAKVIL